MPALRAIALLALLCLASSPARAQEEEAPRPGRYTLGPAFWTPTLRFATGVDTNVFLEQTQATPDTGFVLTPALTAFMPVGRRWRLSGEGGLNLSYFRRETEERFTDRFADGTAELELRRLTLFAGAGGGQFRDRFSIQVDERVLRQEARARAGARLRLSRRFTVSGEVAGESRRYGPTSGESSQDLRDTLDRNTASARAELRWHLTRKTAAVASFEAIEDRFRVPLADGSREVPSSRVLFGFETGPRAFLSGHALFGLRRFPGVGAPQYQGPAISVAVSVPLRLLRVGFVAERDVSYAVTPGEPSERSQRNLYTLNVYRVEAITELPPRLVLRAFAGVEDGRSVLPEPLGGTLARRGDRRYATGGSLLRQVGDPLRLGGFVAYDRRISNLPGFSYERWTYGLEATLTP